MVDQISVFLHVLAATGMVAGGVVAVMAGASMRRATTVEDISQWAGFARAGGFVTLASAVVSLGTGGHLAGAKWTTDLQSGFAYPFITLGAVALVLLAPIGPMLGGAKLRAIQEAARHPETARDLAAMQRSARSAAIWGPVHSLVGVCIGLVWVMTWGASQQFEFNWFLTAIILIVTFALGWLSGVIVSGGAPAATPETSDA